MISLHSRFRYFAYEDGRFVGLMLKNERRRISEISLQIISQEGRSAGQGGCGQCER